MRRFSLLDDRDIAWGTLSRGLLHPAEMSGAIKVRQEAVQPASKSNANAINIISNFHACSHAEELDVDRVRQFTAKD